MDESAAQLNIAEDEDSEEFGEDHEESGEPENSDFLVETSCDVCDRHFSTVRQYQKHLEEHRTCGIDGCTFTAHEKIVDKHIEMQHITGLYDKIRNISTPEDIAQWIEDRKRKYPTKDNVQKRIQQREEMMKRGERLRKNNKPFTKRKDTRFTQSERQRPKQKTKNACKSRKRTKQTSLIDEKLDWNGTLFPFKGTSEIYAERVEETHSDFDDSEWLEESHTEPAEDLKLNNSLGVLMSVYNSDDDCEDDVLPTQIIQENSSNFIKDTAGNGNDDDAPLEVKIEREPEQSVAISNNLNPSHQQQNCKKKRKKLKSDVPNKKLKPEEAVKEVSFINQPFRKRKITLLERLLDSEIRHERNVLLQCVRFVMANKCFRKQ